MTMNTNTNTNNEATEETVVVAQDVTSKLSGFTRKALMAVAVVGAIGGAYYYFTKAKKVVAEVAGETTEPAAEETPAV